MNARRVLVSVSTKSAHWSQIDTSPQDAVDISMDLIKQKKDLIPELGEPRLLVVEKWGSRTHIVFDLLHDTYNSDNAHLPDQGNLPVIAVWLSGQEVAQVATEGVKNRVNDEVRDMHRRFGDGGKPPFYVDHSDGKVPVFVNPRRTDSD